MSKKELNEESRRYWQERVEVHDKKMEKDTLKLEKQLKWNILYDFESGIKETMEWYVRNN